MAIFVGGGSVAVFSCSHFYYIKIVMTGLQLPFIELIIRVKAEPRADIPVQVSGVSQEKSAHRSDGPEPGRWHHYFCLREPNCDLKLKKNMSFQEAIHFTNFT